ncbi:MAG TPA: MFS transporter [Burkholderiaceae bacterium]|nr:MFS transporter [Burkholderiaceae bacterium]
MSTSLPAPCDTALAKAATANACRHPRATLAACILGSSLAFIDGSVVNVALPAIDQALHAGAAGLAWLVNAYLLCLSALILLGGAAGDHGGRRRMFLAGIALFLVASLGCALAPTLAVVLAFRALQGIGAALLLPNSLALLGAGFEGEAQGKAVGTWAGVGALAGAIGPVLGGWLVDVAGWRTIFLVNLPVGCAAMWLAWRYVPESRGQATSTSLDWPGAACITLALGLGTWALTAASEPQADRAALLAIGAVGLAALVAFGMIEVRRGEAALMPLYLMRDRTFLGLTLLTLLLYAALGGLIVVLPYVLIRAQGYDPVQAGAALLPVPLLIAAGSRAMGRFAARRGARVPLATGAALVACGLAAYVRVHADSSYWVDVLPATALVAFGMAICVAPLTASVISSVDADHVGAASGFNSAVARIGGLLATAWLGLVFGAQARGVGLLGSAHEAAWVGAGLAALAAACAVTLVRDKPRHARD